MVVKTIWWLPTAPEENLQFLETSTSFRCSLGSGQPSLLGFLNTLSGFLHIQFPTLPTSLLVLSHPVHLVPSQTPSIPLLHPILLLLSTFHPHCLCTYLFHGCLPKRLPFLRVGCASLFPPLESIVHGPCYIIGILEARGARYRAPAVSNDYITVNAFSCVFSSNCMS